MESWPQNPEFRNTPENFHPCETPKAAKVLVRLLSYNLMLAHFIKLKFPYMLQLAKKIARRFQFLVCCGTYIVELNSIEL